MNILAINPWIVDFAAYDFWLKPYGFLVLLTYLRNNGAKIDYIDCLDEKTAKGNFGRGKYPFQIIPKPAIYKSIPRHFKRYGISPDDFKKQLNGRNPDYILITSSMTYWYPAIVDLAEILRKKFPAAPLILGGTYATLCASHAQKTIPCDFIYTTENLAGLFKRLGINFNPREFYATLPRYRDFYPRLDYLVLRTSWGCPFECSFCAIKKLAPAFLTIGAQKIVNFILEYARKGVADFVLYDDAFLYAQDYAKTLLAKISGLKLNINFHTPNALHLRFLDRELAALLKETGFINPHFGLETLDPKLQKKWGDKANRKDLIAGVNNLRQAGFKKGEFSIYLLLGYPGQNLATLKEDAKNLHSLGAKGSLAEFSPVPGTKLFKKYRQEFADPLRHNNSIFGFFQKDKIKDFWEIKNYVRGLNRKIETKGLPLR